MSALQNLADLLEELDKEYPRIRLFKEDGLHLWRISTADGQSLGALTVKMMPDGCCAKITAFDHNSIVQYPNTTIMIMVPNLSDEEEQNKIRELLESIRDKVVI